MHAFADISFYFFTHCIRMQIVCGCVCECVLKKMKKRIIYIDTAGMLDVIFLWQDLRFKHNPHNTWDGITLLSDAITLIRLLFLPSFRSLHHSGDVGNRSGTATANIFHLTKRKDSKRFKLSY